MCCVNCRRWPTLLLLVTLLARQDVAAGQSQPGSGSGQQPVASDSFAGTKAGDQRRVRGIELCWCPPGKFRMGSPRDEPERRPGEEQVDVTLTRGFWIGKFEVTQGQW